MYWTFVFIWILFSIIIKLSGNPKTAIYEFTLVYWLLMIAFILSDILRRIKIASAWLVQKDIDNLPPKD